MPEPVSISKSVARAFAVLELFREHRQPLTAAEIGRRLAWPQPSTRALLKTLVAIGYLACTGSRRTYLPTARLTALGQWLPAEHGVPQNLLRAVDQLTRLADETTSLSALRAGHVEILYVRKARHPIALQLEPGPGVAAWRTAVGRALLAGLDEVELADLLQGWLRQARSPADRRTLQALPRELKRVRTDNCLAGYDIFLKGVGAICVPVPPASLPPGADPLVVAIAGLNDRIRQREVALLRMIRSELRRARQDV